MIENYGSDYLYASIPNLLGPLQGQGRETLEWRFIRLASDPSSNFNLHLYPVTLLDISHSPAATSSSSTTVSVLGSPLLPVSRLRRSHSGRSSILPPSGKGTFWLGIGPNGFEFHEVGDFSKYLPCWFLSLQFLYCCKADPKNLYTWLWAKLDRQAYCLPEELELLNPLRCFDHLRGDFFDRGVKEALLWITKIWKFIRVD